MIHLPHFQNAHVLVVGDVILDRYLFGPIHRISPEAPVPVVEVDRVNELPGGAANVALNMRQLGANVTLLGIIGKDREGSLLSSMLEGAGISTHFIETSEPTIQKNRVVSSRQQLLRFDIEKTYTPHPEALLSNYKAYLSKANVVILSDYAKGTLHQPSPFIQLANKQKVPVLVDPKAKDFERYAGAHLLTPNTKEFEALVGPCKNEADMIEKGTALLHQHRFDGLLITRGIHGMVLISKNQSPLLLKALAQEIFDVTGAGDTVIATLAAGLGAGADLVTAVKLSNFAAAISVRKPGTSTVSLQELRQELQRQNTLAYSIFNETELLTALIDAKAHGERIVMTNGCFDLLHAGHIAYLAEAKSWGDRLIVAVNDDASVSRLKGEGRPIHSLEHRMQVLSGLRAVDWVVPFSEDTPERLIQRLKPDVLVKGGDYTEAQIAGAKFVRSLGGEVKILSFLAGCSTSHTIQKIKDNEKQKEIA